MKQTFTKYLGRITEKLELGLEEKWIYLHYTKGGFERTACILKNAEKSQQEYLDSFYKENGVSEAMKKEVEKFFMNEKEFADGPKHWKEFSNFLMKTLSINMVLGITIALSVYGGYKIGTLLDARYSLNPLFTLVGLFSGIGISVLTGYSMVQKYPKSSVQGNADQTKVKTDSLKKDSQGLKEYPLIEVTLEEVRKAIREFSDNLPKGVYRTILVKEDNSIDFEQLASILKGLPTKKYYMSKETYDLFEENEKQIPIEMDRVQKAVDQYVKEHKEFPMLKFDPDHRVNYYQLLQEHYLNSPPEIQFYITDLDGLVTHIKPGKKLGNSS
jgi:5-bromo-4-chloroindolyl phosphate hydrolysis protein